ncbi:Hydrogen peroxide-inducible genes activator [Roseivivax jejudonensis]|uniref:Hydrogen peroxide-inducible genes activator n=1 Tax=Roseivivax jejudonensis TaxID=1529041 RepID=A0A1X6Y4V3_9RHOB|nr:LysR family transcriptional regulator [Roseivivax jejudonensis]SLN10409.1 Hydrogen peroxide-inducible genes activator [Roseivivax jejudonensis]
MELRQVRYFLALSETRNFTRAAEMCDVTQPTLTLSIKKLEDEMGGPLVHRERGNTHLTQLGEMLLPFLAQVYESSTAASRLASEIAHGERVPLNFGVSDVVRKALLIAPLRETGNAAEGLELHVEGGSDGDLVQRLVDGVLHLALVDETAISADRLRFHPIYREALSVLMLADDPLTESNRLRSADIVGRPWITLDGSPVHEALQTRLQSMSAEWTPRHRANRSADAQILCLAGMGLTLIGQQEPVLPGLVARPLDDVSLSRTIGIAEARGRPLSSTALSFTRLLRALSVA